MLTVQIDSFKHLRCSYNVVMAHDDRRPRVGISRCLLGDEVRYDGGHKRDDLLLSALGSFVQWVPVCPEVEAGMGTPREAIDLVASDNGVTAGGVRVRLLGAQSRTDWTATMVTFAAARVRQLLDLDLDGYVLKADSPSCGLERVRVHREEEVSRDGRGLFAEALVTVFPNLPVEEDRRLSDRAVRENFIVRVFEQRRRRLALR
jgi:uncharacterized protein YbbK (DUF523 family)